VFHLKYITSTDLYFFTFFDADPRAGAILASDLAIALQLQPAARLPLRAAQATAPARGRLKELDHEPEIEM